MNILKMKDIKIYQQHTLVTLNDWRVLITEKSPLEIFNRLKDNSVIYIEWEMHSRYSIASAREQNIDELESLICSQSKEIQSKLREKKNRLRKELWKEMTVSYARNYLNTLLEN